MTSDLTAADVLLSDGNLAVVRSLAPGDAAALHDLHDRVSGEALWFRFFAARRATAHRYVDHVMEDPDRLALVAEVDGRLVALATAEPLVPARPHSAEVAFLVADDCRGHGLGTLLLEHLAALARDRGIREFEANVLQANYGMLRVFDDAGFRVARHLDEGVEILRFDIAVTAEVQAAADRREFAAEARSLHRMLAPRAVAVYGVRRDGSGIGAAVVSAIREGGFTGTLSVVHPRSREVLGLPAHSSVRDVPEAVDLVVIAVPAPDVIAALEDAAAAGVPAAVVISSGFSEMGVEGAELQAGLAAAARRLGIRVVGPNCFGLVCNDPGVRLNATFGRAVPTAGGLAVASQSGGVGIALMDLVDRAGIGLRYFVSLGNKADVSGNDLLAAWYGDDAVTCAALYLESFGNARKFARFARTFSERKPLVAVIGGRSTSGSRAGASHTAAAATPAVGVRALFAQAGVIGCKDAEELADTTLLLTREPLPAGTRVAVVSNAGGLGVLAADAAEDEGLHVVELSAGLQQALGGLVNQTTGTANPVDAGAGAEPDQLAGIADALAASGEVDALVAVIVATGTTDIPATLRRLGRVRAAHPDLPLLVVPLAAPADGAAAEDTGTTVFASAAAALGALGRAARYAEWRRTVPAAIAPSDPLRVKEARTLASSLLRTGHDGWVAPAAAAGLLGRYGIDLVGELAIGSAAATAAAREVGFPVAVKLAEAEVVHKTEGGLVRTGLGSAEEVEAAVADFERHHGTPCTVLVQPMVHGVELALGVVRDPVLGPLVMIAAGGVATDVWDDRAFLVPPFDAADAGRVLRSLRIWPLFDGFRGAPRAASEHVAALAARVGRLAVDVPEVLELDLNPVMVGQDDCSVVDAKLRLAPADAAHLDLPRQLRRTH